jgi:cytosine/adenosine deaminase-related metal-dependent hydrolase
MNSCSLNSPWHGTLVDAHRHGLYDLSSDWSLAGVPVEQWSDDPRFLAYERRTKWLFGEDLRDAIRTWIEYSCNEGVGTVLDFSGKHASADMEYVYRTFGVRSKVAVFWNCWSADIWPIPAVMILPDEREIGPEAADAARAFLKSMPEGLITLHAGESETRARIGESRLGRSIVEWLAMESLLDSRTLLVHANTLNSNDFGLIEDSGAGVVMCPLTRAALFNPTPKIPQGVRIFFGTDAPLVSGSRSLIAQALTEAEWWITFGYTEIAAAERAAIALTRPQAGKPLEASGSASDLAEFLYNNLIKEK